MIEAAGDGLYAIAGRLSWQHHRQREYKTAHEQNTQMSHHPGSMRHPLSDTSSTRTWTRHLVALALAWLLATAWGTVVQTQFNLHALTTLGVDVPISLRAQTLVQDLLGFGPVYGSLVAAGWLPALAAATWLARRWPNWRSTLLAAGAGLGLIAAVKAVDAVAPMPAFIDATRGLPGLLLMAAGAVLAGWLYARLTRPNRLSS